MIRNPFFTLICCFCAIVGTSHGTPSYTVIPDKATTPIKTPALANQKIAKIKLANGLQAYIISDPTANLSGAAMSVNVGSWEDPDEYPGLAHFLEHMLFLGTKKYPKESEFDKYVSENGGEFNAFTANDTTSYLFTINHKAFSEGLDRFSNFFKEPIFNPSGVSRELKAIDQEYAKNVENDHFREYYVYKEQLNPQHPSHRFNAGNSETLSGVSQETLKEWYKNHYSANLMRLIVYSSKPLDALINMVVEDFSGVPNTDKTTPVITIPAFKPSDPKQMIYIEPVKNTRSLSMVWELPTRFYDMKDTQPGTLLCYVLGDEGENSLLAQLKKESLADGLSCGSIREGEKLENLYLDINLTPLGLRNIDQVIARCFQAIKNLKEKGFPPYLFDEIQTLAKNRYQYQSFENEFAMLMERVQLLQKEDFSTFPEQTLIPQKFSPQVIKDLLSYLTPQNVHLFITAPSSETGVATDKTEKWMGTHYAIQPVKQEYLDKWQTVNPISSIDLPQPNPFIPRNLSLINQIKANAQFEFPQPITLIDNDRARIYFASDTYYQVPKISWTLQFRTPGISMNDPAKIVTGDLFVKFLKDALVKFSYPAKLADLDFDVERQNNGIKFELNGYSQNAPILLNEFIKLATNLNPTADKFSIFKDILLRHYQNNTKDSPLEQSFEILKSTILENYSTDKQKAAALKQMTFENFLASLANIWDEVYIEGVFYGNMTEDNAKSLSDNLLKTFNKGSYPVDQQFHPKILVLSDKEGPYYLESQTQMQGSAVVLAIENPDFSLKERAAQQILMQALKEPFFTSLRTQQQTGYIVTSMGQEIERKLFDFFVVQTNTHDVRDLLARFEAFLEGFIQELGITKLSEDQFNLIKHSLLDQLKQPPLNMKAMGALLGQLALDYDGDFNWMNKRIQAMKDLSYKEFIQITQKTLGKQNKRRLAILLQGIMPSENSLHYSKAKSQDFLRNSGKYEERTRENSIYK